MVLSKIEGFLEWLGGVLVALMGLMICATVFGRTFFGTGVPGDVVLVGEFMVVAMSIPIAAAIARDQMIKIDILVRMFPPAIQKVLARIAVIIGLMAMTPIAYVSWQQFVQSWERGTVYEGLVEIVAWPGKLGFFVGMLFIVIRLAVQLFSGPIATGRQAYEDDREA